MSEKVKKSWLDRQIKLASRDKIRIAQADADGFLIYTHDGSDGEDGMLYVSTPKQARRIIRALTEAAALMPEPPK